MNKITQFMGYGINTLPIDELVQKCQASIEHKTGSALVFSCANPHAIATAEQKPVFRDALKHSDILVVDGVGVSIIGKLIGKNLNPRITGSDFFSALMNRANSSKHTARTRVFFLGSSQKVLDLMHENLKIVYPNIEYCGFISPPYGDWSEQQNKKFIDQINASGADVLWVGMTAPKQELWSQANRHKLNVSVIGNVGAVFDFCAGTYERAPRWAQRIGIEWLVRLCKEPKRMWRRNFISPILFSAAAFRWTFIKKVNSQ